MQEVVRGVGAQASLAKLDEAEISIDWGPPTASLVGGCRFPFPQYLAHGWSCLDSL